MRNIILFIVLLFCLGLIAIFYVDHLENPRSEFKDYTSLAKSGLIERGWVPESLPKSARDIKDQHDIDTNMVQMSFTYDVADAHKLKDTCTLISETDKGWKYICPPYDGSTRIFTLRRDGYGYYGSYMDGLDY